MRPLKTMHNLIICVIIALLALPVCVFADTDDNLNNADYIPNQETDTGSPSIGTNEYGDTFYEGDYNDYEHATTTERTITLLLPYQLDGRTCELTVNGETGSGTLDNGDIVFTVPYADEYNINVDTSDIAMPDDILTTNIPGASLTDEGDVTVRIDMGTAWAGAVFSAQSELSLYEVAFSVDNDGILTVCADAYQDLTIYVNYGGDELYPVYEEGDAPEEDDDEIEEIIMEGSSEEAYEEYLESIGVDPDDENLDEAIAEAEAAKETESEIAEETENTGTESEGSGTTVMIIIVVIIVVLIVAGVIVYYVIRNRNREQYKIDESVYDEDEDEYNDSEGNDDENDNKN